MMQPRVSALLESMDSFIPGFVLSNFCKRDIVFCFEQGQGEKSGRVCVYANGPEGDLGVDVPLEKDWFCDSKLWFRMKQNHVEPAENKYEAFISYLSEYRDRIVVNLKNPLVCLPVPESCLTGTNKNSYLPICPSAFKQLELAGV
jgi:hypothetical protein